ncbi:xanthine dehydrogenase small subunit [Aquabacterium sp. OR-4]|uniref:xanthine dehydrogenase small subunit n=1 Tax=Aquabacterium sp. OR-4 TaxID=2978127 RepID=UPI0028CA4BA6|nr:xanthine dehydrogenase small subunit [Aquabacterium sp. OR-4]MDT7837061.1 xanthine dehydrogenase small subunit [Aquabacterium sp. OR-4]
MPESAAPATSSPADEQAAAARPIRFVHRGALRELSGLPATTTLLGWLREQQRLTGTKEGCNEGDCGACTVLLGELDAEGDVRFKPVNSCIQWLPTLDGKALLTVEDLGGSHPVQQAMVACHGAQCGFCTPGIVMSLAGTAERCAAAGLAATRAQLADDLSGNLCRCTGYRPILDAGEQALASPAALPRLATPALAAQLRALQADAPLQLPACTAPDGATGPAFHAPRSVAQLAALRQQHPQATLLAGCTDIGLWLNKQLRRFEHVISLGAVAGLQAIHVADGALHIGAGASLQAAWAALARHWPATTEMGRRFASRPVREAGTLGGNIANGSPIGDGAPVLMALGATLHLRLGTATRSLPLEAFYLGYMRHALQPGEFIEAIAVPLPQPADTLRAWKLSKRFDCDISALACGLHLRLQGDTVAEARFAFGGLAATVARARQAEAAVIGQPWTAATARAAMAALAHDFQPLSDLRASAAHRQRTAANLMWRLWLETRPVDPLPASATTVWEAA